MEAKKIIEEIKTAKNEIRNIKRRNNIILILTAIIDLIILFTICSRLVIFMEPITNITHFYSLLIILYTSICILFFTVNYFSIGNIIKKNNNNIVILHEKIIRLNKMLHEERYEELYNLSKIHKIQSESSKILGE